MCSCVQTANYFRFEVRKPVIILSMSPSASRYSTILAAVVRCSESFAGRSGKSSCVPALHILSEFRAERLVSAGWRGESISPARADGTKAERYLCTEN